MLNLSDENFEQEVIKANKPILVDFYADWCPPCKLLMPVLEKIEKEMKGKFILAKANVDNVPLAAQKFEANKIPHIILFNQGNMLGGFTGLMPEPALKETSSPFDASLTARVIKEWLEEHLIKN